MIPTHHPNPEDLMAYSSGTAPEWMSVGIACHLTYCPDCRGEVAALDSLGGALLDSLEADDAPDRIVMPAARPVPAAPPSMSGVVPSPLTRKIPRPLHPYFKETSPEFRFLAPGLKHVPLTLAVGEMPARLIQFKPGFVVPDHRHSGTEMVLVLDGVLEDTVTREVFRTGDMSRRDESSARHGNVASSEDPCICLVLTDGPIDPATMWGKIVKALTGL
jgi:putative transcriptional regulator